ncbi:hypothetical protein Pmani_009898 [Petrolisthes manimaculis]|uniref:Uncharacterized protein n=1 Tax=Petrolisthes manimaculis TaxID=1843537 RepID=A0AAE1Q3A3_9EUCA|nr:hypothetical protein Pmani_009898 [Petrolisthes manimaculis]
MTAAQHLASSHLGPLADSEGVLASLTASDRTAWTRTKRLSMTELSHGEDKLTLWNVTPFEGYRSGGVTRLAFLVFPMARWGSVKEEEEEEEEQEEMEEEEAT